MSDHFTRRRYLIDFDCQRLGQVFTDVLVIGAGVAGLRAALSASDAAGVVVVTKDRVPDCNTSRAQGGIAVVVDPKDSMAAHVEDTLSVGCGVGHRDAVEVIAREGPARFEELLAWGAAFDVERGAVALGLEGGHSAARIVHARGDATGGEVSRVLAESAAARERIRIFEQCFVIDLLTDDGRCVGALTYHPKYGHQAIWASATILASGGAGCLYRETTNAPSATADGHAIAFRAGVRLRDMELVQFHPTTLYVAGATRALISEAVRGEGALLVDQMGVRFMVDAHPMAELAPRDVVSRAIVRRMAETGATCVFLDVRGLPLGRFESRFPNITRLCRDFDIDVTRDLIPVRPAAHYMIGGAAADLQTHTSMEGLLACGEASSSGVHGANRLASNSLLEGLVFGHRAGVHAAELAAAAGTPTRPKSLVHRQSPSERTELDLHDVRNSLRALSWRNLGIERAAGRLEETIDILDFWGRYVMDKVLETRDGWETQNMLTVARCIAQAALARAESRGVHYRTDHPEQDDQNFRGHITLQRTPVSIRQDFEAVGSP